MPRDIFPTLGIPTIYVAQPYGGMDPAQMEGYLTYYYEYHFLYITGIEHVESKSIQGAAIIKLQFHPGTDMAQAMSETVAYVNRARAFMPPGTVPPFIMRFDAGSVPVGNLVFSSETRTVGEMQDAALEPGPAALRHAARRLGAAALWRQRPQHRRQCEAGPSPRLQHVAGRSRRGHRRRQHHQPSGNMPHWAISIRWCRSIRVVKNIKDLEECADSHGVYPAVFRSRRRRGSWTRPTS